MSKQNEAKTAQGFVKKAIPNSCGNCENFAFDTVPWSANPVYTIRKKLRCGIGEFAVTELATCARHEPKHAD